MERGERLLVPITYGFSVRYLLPTGILEGLAEICMPVVGLGWDDPTLESELVGRGFDVVRLPDAKLQHSYRSYRRLLAAVHERRLASPTTAIRWTRDVRSYDRDLDRAVAVLRRGRDLLSARVPGRAEAIEAQEPSAIEEGTNVAAFREALREHRVEALLSVTPYHDQDGLLLWAAREAGVRSLTSVISFDNPTTRARLLARSDRVVVWNEHNRRELLRSYPDLSEDRIGVIGAPQFDLHRRPDLLMDRAEWCAALGIPADRPVILHGASPPSLVPGEPALATAIDRLIAQRRLPDDPHLLVRRHPGDVGATWEEVRLRHGTVVDPWAPGATAFQGWPTEDDLRIQMSTLAHAEVHVNVCSSMTLDGAMFDRPQIGPTFVPGAERADARHIRALYRQEHWQPVARSGGVAMVGDEMQLEQELRAAIEAPAAHARGRARMLADVVTYDDGRSSRRLVDEVSVL